MNVKMNLNSEDEKLKKKKIVQNLRNPLRFKKNHFFNVCISEITISLYL